ncbi:MAG: hypothetical protein AAF192_16925 [Pseudomonadota bacterium]
MATAATLAAGPAAALIHAPDWRSPPHFRIVDAWTIGARPDGPAERTGDREVGLLHHAVDARNGSLATVLFPDLSSDTPLPATLTHQAVASPRRTLPKPPLAPKMPLPDVPPDGVSFRWQKPMAAYFPMLLTGAPEEVVERARFGLRDPLRAGLAVGLVGATPFGADAVEATRDNLAGLSAAGPAPVREIEADSARRSLVVIGLLGVVGGVGLLLAVLFRGDKKPKPLRSRRFG